MRMVMAMLAVASSGIFGGPAVVQAGIGASRPPRELVYVANADTGPVTAYAADSSGAVGPVRRLRNPHDPNTFWDPWGIAFDAGGTAYVQTFLSDATSFVFPPRSSTVRRIFRVTGPDLESIAVDAQGYEYVMGGEGPPVISVAPPQARGAPSSLYSVSPLRQIRTTQLGVSPWPSVLAADDHHHILAVVLHARANAIEEFESGPDGASSPVGAIDGVHNGLGSCPTIATCDHVAITYAPHTDQIYAAVSGSTGGRILVFPGGASADAPPLRTISGRRTGLGKGIMTGIAISPRTGDIYVLAKSAQFESMGWVEVFSGGARGNVRPLRRFTDAASRFAEGQGIAIPP
jgi:hypothetical protein